MNAQRIRASRRGTVLPMLGMCLVALFSFVALAIDLGMLAVARTDCQNAADISSLAGARTLNNKPGVVDSNRPAAIAKATAAVTVNYDIGATFANSQIQSVTAGQYTYDTTAQTFSVSYPNSIAAGQSWTAMQVVLSVSQPTFFMKVWGVTTMPTGATAVAVHRPRDLALVIDMTGSMGYGSIPRLNDKIGSAANGLNDPNTMWPQFSHMQRYTDYTTNNITGSETGTLGSRPNPLQQMGSQTSAPYIYAPTNLTIETPNGKAIVRDFYYDPSNLADPTVAVTSTNGSNFRNAFHQWSPAESGADPVNYVGPTYTMTGYNAMDTSGANGALPAPDNFKTQLDTPIAYVGDKYPRKYGFVATTTSTPWDSTDPKGAAINLAEYLGWCPKYTGSGTWPGNPPSRSSMTPSTAYATSGSGSTICWTNFRDATWERYGYDLDVANYVANRGASWDPRWDWDKTLKSGAGDWAHYRPSDPSATYRPSVTAGNFKGYSMGPGYFGKTFFIWPPDPRTPVGDPGSAGYVPGDWRRRYFNDRSGNAFNPQSDADTNATNWQTIDGELFTDGTGDTLNSSSNNWGANYSAILKWIKTGPMVLPPNLRSGHVLYYSSIPDTTTAKGSDSADVAADKVFWQTYIDYDLKTGDLAGPEPMGWPEGITPNTDTSTATGTGYALPSSPKYYVDPDATTKVQKTSDPLLYSGATNNPSRPRLHFWFGPLTMMMFLNQYNYWSGTTHQAQCWQLKAGINSAIDDIRNNHPNDNVGMVFFTTPQYKTIQVPIGQDYATLKNSLFYPKSKLTLLLTDNTTELRPYDSSGLGTSFGDIPNAQSNTDPVTGMALAYNILSPAPSVNADPARRGRKGAAKVVVFETDGIPNSTQPFNLTKAGYNSYYVYGGSTPNSDPYGATTDVVTQICKQTAVVATAGTDSGFSLPNAPARVYSIGFGDIFSTTSAATASTFLLNIQKAGNTSASTDTSIPSYQIITGTYQTRISNLKDGLQRILQGGVQVTLIQ